uniref:Protein-glutamine gamma-glutamyltransferase 2 n=1 Tax=Mola mola TaxID=94237 RepID=A0A3Q3X8I6_MOLML
MLTHLSEENVMDVQLQDLHCELNNTDHHTNQISVDQLILRRGQSFKVTLTLTKSFNGDLHPLVVTAMTGHIPDNVEPSTSAKGAWKMELDKSSLTSKGITKLIIFPPANAPIGEYTLQVKYKDEEILLANLVLLFNPWCLDDWVFLPDEEERQEYVLNEEGIVYRGSVDYISSMYWDFGQFEDSMVNICMKILDLSHKHVEDPADDVSNRYDPMYVSRIVSAMINSEDEHGVVKGRWGGPYFDGYSPGHWNGSYPILKQWLKTYYRPVKYGQCWVFASVMCSVMRFLGIPCRVVTNFVSAHDNNGNLTIDANFHVWVEGWMKRPDLSNEGKFDGWQVLDPTPQEMSGGKDPLVDIYEYIGETHLKYDIPFVFAEVNADCISWLVRPDGSLVKINSDPKRVGQNISTKSVGTQKRQDITSTYKHREGGFPWQTELSIPVLIEFSVYNKPMLECASMKVSVVVTDKLNPDNTYVAEDDIVLLDPPISLTVRRKPLKSPSILCVTNNHKSELYNQYNMHHSRTAAENTPCTHEADGTGFSFARD